ncbi:hypothetical protein NQ176_g8094 [Zarea fungicola]|uniref:Uncharacterized protein n=1 Tax=Zarea fungicola TaxID=93591 RepID=A0ACC1MWR6_9HYPO|nr:hypothetical protein NQ176_g8094 [Lecanicillium fungicola]
MVMQMDWMQARWEREASMRSDAANKAQLRELEHIRTKIFHSRKPLLLTDSAEHPPTGESSSRKPTLKTFLVIARFIARMRLSARSWAEQEAVRRKLVAVMEEKRKEKRSKGFRVVRVEDITSSVA